MATILAGVSGSYGDISSDPGRRGKTQKFDTTLGSTELTLAADPTVNEARAAVAAEAIAQRAVTATGFGLASRVDAS